MTLAEELEPTVSADTRRPSACSGDTTAAEPQGRGDRRRVSTLAIALVALSPFAVGAFSIIKRGYPAGALFGDRAILALTARDA